MDNDSWVASEYRQFWNLSDELAGKEKGDKTERRDKHIQLMVAMFLSTMNATQESCEDEEECEGGVDCNECDNLNNCKTQWQAKQN